MPELPEVETVRRGLAPAMTGARIDAVEARRADIRFPLPAHFRQRLTGKRVVKLSRRAKYLLMELDSGETLIAHLGMSGSFRIEEATPDAFHHPRSKDPKHDHVVFHLDNGRTVTYNDPRRFGFMDLADTGALAENRHLAGLGAEPLGSDFDAARLAQLFAGSRAPLKSALLDQKRIAGLGNIYACEALWRAKLLPSHPAGILTSENPPSPLAGEGLGVRGRRASAFGAHPSSGAPRHLLPQGEKGRARPTRAAKALAPAIRAVLEEAIEAGGSTLRDHRKADGDLGYFQHSFAVYDREGLPCLRPRCRGVIRRATHAGRSTFWCPVCQR